MRSCSLGSLRTRALSMKSAPTLPEPTCSVSCRATARARTHRTRSASSSTPERGRAGRGSLGGREGASTCPDCAAGSQTGGSCSVRAETPSPSRPGGRTCPTWTDPLWTTHLFTFSHSVIRSRGSNLILRLKWISINRETGEFEA